MLIAHRDGMLAYGIHKYDGTSLLLKTGDNTREVFIDSLVKHSSSQSIIIDWGDGSAPIVVAGSSASELSHTYPASKLYMLHISDDVAKVGFKKLKNYRNIVAYCSLGGKVSTISSLCFQDHEVDTNPSSSTWCGLTKQEAFDVMFDYTKDVELVVNASTLGVYSFFPRARNVRFTKLETVSGICFYSGGLYYVQNLTFDSPSTRIPGDYLYDWSNFFNSSPALYPYKTLTFSAKTVAQIKDMESYPWRAWSCPWPVYIRGIDGEITPSNA